MRNWIQQGRALTQKMARDTSGAAAIEFTFIAIVLFVLLAGVVDLVDEQTRQREIDRISVEVAEAMADCPDSDCVRVAVQDILRSSAVILNEVSGATLGAAEVARMSSGIVVLQGTMTYLPNDVKNEALAVLANGDIGVAVLVSYNYRPAIGLFPGSPHEIRSFSVALRAKDITTL